MEKMTILIAVKDRWLDNDQYDQNGQLIRWPNPNPTVVWHSGCWDRKNGQGVMMTLDAKTFTSLTGHIVYGGDVERRGVHKITILWGRFTKLKAYRESGDIMTARKAKPVIDRLKAAREGRAQQLQGVQARIRKRKA